MDQVIDGLIAILDEEHVQQVRIIGLSMGGYMAQYFLNKYPERLDKLILGNTFPPNDVYKKENGGLRKMLPFIPEWYIMWQFKNNASEKVVSFSENSPLVEAYLPEQYSGYMTKAQLIGRLDIVLDFFKLQNGQEQRNISKLLIESDNDPLVSSGLRESLKTLYPEARVFTFHAKRALPLLK